LSLPLELDLPAVTESVRTARHAVAGFTVDHAVDHVGIAIAVSEAVANAVVHAYPDTPGGHVRLHASLEPEALLIVISDDGQGIAARSDSAGLGAGLTLIARLCSSSQIEGDGGGTTVTMRFVRRD
jgi:serine/threonine-protein kinase RsbW